MTERTQTDWEAVEVAYRAGVRTLRDIAEEYGVSHTAIRKRAERDGWPRDLSAKIAAKAEELVSKHSVSSTVSKITELETINANAELQASAILRHRKDAKQQQEITQRLIEELESCGEDLAKRVSINKMLAETRRILVNIEREAFGIDKDHRLEGEGGDGVIEVRFVR